MSERHSGAASSEHSAVLFCREIMRRQVHTGAEHAATERPGVTMPLVPAFSYVVTAFRLTTKEMLSMRSRPALLAPAFFFL